MGAKFVNEISTRWSFIKDALEGVTKADSLDPEAKIIYDAIQAENANPDPGQANWSQKVSWTVGGDLLLQAQFKQNIPGFTGVTDTMVKKMTSLNDLEQDVFIKIIMNKAPIEDFDLFVTQWKEMGGTEILEEINSIVK